MYFIMLPLFSVL